MNRSSVETIKQKLTIESVIGSYVKLEPAGRNFRACCPFHNEKTPSFYVTPDKGIFYCYGCHKGGDIFTFVQEVEGIEFFDALKSLAEKAGVTLDEFQNEKTSRTSTLREIMDTATKYYEVGLRTNSSVVEYLIGRGMAKDTMIAFRIGYASKGWSGLYDTLRRKKYSDEDIIATGLCIKGPKGTYDRFRERIMFPIADSQGRIIAFTGRVMPGTEEANRPVGKYINSPETDLYHKSSVLFGFDKAKQAIHTEGFALLVEGQMDAIMSHQAGVKNTIALSGTACTDEHLTQIGRFTNNIAICLDADNAGFTAAQKTAMLAYQKGFHIALIGLPKGADPADMIKENPELWKVSVTQKTDFISYRLEQLVQDPTADKIAIATKELFPVLAYIPHRITLDEKIQQIAHAFRVSDESVRSDFEDYLKKNPRTALDQGHSSQTEAPKILLKNDSVLADRLVGIIYALEKNETPVSLQEKFPEVAAEILAYLAPMEQDLKSRYAFQIEQQLGRLPDALPLYERTLADMMAQYELVKIEQEKHLLDHQLRHHPEDSSILGKIHDILKRRESLIHQLIH